MQPDKTERWKFRIPEEEEAPDGPFDCARSAIARLGPFKYELQDDAERYRPREGLGGRLALSEQLAFERVWALARTFKQQERLERNAPRSKDVIERLVVLEILAGELSRFLNELDDMTRHRLQTGGTGISTFRECSEIAPEINVAGLPLPDGCNEQAPFQWAISLEALSQYAGFCRHMFLQSKGITDGAAPDKGGNKNLYKDLYGSARWALVNNGWHVYELFKPGKATGTEGGPFHLFLLEVFEYATGLDPEEHAKLTFWLKHVAKVNRRHADIQRRQRAIEAEMRKIKPYQPDDTSNPGCIRFQELSQEFMLLERQRTELWPSLFPFTYPKPKRGQPTPPASGQ